jgi:signal transduction histidine kinase
MIRSLRVRLILTFTLIFGAIQLVLGVVGLTARQSYIDAYFDDQLIRRADSIVTNFLKEPGRFSSERLSAMILSESRTPYFRDFYLQVSDTSGQVLGRSGNLAQFRLPMNPEALATAKQGRREYETLEGSAVDEVAGPMQQLRMVTVFIRPDARPPLFVQVATSTQHIEESKDFLRQLFLIGIPAGLAAAALASWFAADRAVHAIHDVTTLAGQTTPEEMGRRVNAAELEGEVGDMAKNINQMLDRLETGFNAQQRFIHDASHELKTPVSVLQSEAQVLQISKPTEAEYRKFVHSVAQEMERLGRLIESLLMITRAEGRHLVMLSRIESVNDLVVDVASRHVKLAQEQGLTLRILLHLPEDMPEHGFAIRGDPELCDAMLSNLIRNAIHYSPAGTLITVRVLADQQEVVIEVIDEGPCIPQAEQDKIFTRFVRGSTAGQRHGSGLGLAIAKSVADLHGGKITVEDGPEGQGCVFAIRLPLIGPDEPEAST